MPHFHFPSCVLKESLPPAPGRSGLCRAGASTVSPQRPPPDLPRPVLCRGAVGAGPCRIRWQASLLGVKKNNCIVPRLHLRQWCLLRPFLLSGS